MSKDMRGEAAATAQADAQRAEFSRCSPRPGGRGTWTEDGRGSSIPTDGLLNGPAISALIRDKLYVPGFSTSAAQSHMKFVPMVTLSTWQ